MINKILDAIDWAECWLSRILLAAMAILVAFGSINRFTLKLSTPWVDELVGFLFVWLTLVSAAVGITHKVHVGIDVVTSHLSEKAQRYIERFVNACGIILCIIMVYLGWDMTVSQASQLTTIMRISISWLYASMPVGWAMMAVAFAGRIYRSFERKGEKDAN